MIRLSLRGPLTAAAVGLVVAAVAFRIEPGVFYSGDGGIKYQQVRQVLAGDTATVLSWPGPPWMAALHARGMEPVLFPFVTPEFIQYPPWFPHVVAAAVRAVGDPGWVLVQLLSLFGLWAVCWRAGRVLPQGWSRTLALLAVIGTPVTVYGALFWEHTLAVLLVTFGLVGPRFRSPERPLELDAPTWLAALAGLSLAASAWLRTECGIMAALVVLFEARRGLARAPWCAWAVTVVLGGLGLLAANQVLYGDPMGAHSQQTTRWVGLDTHFGLYPLYLGNIVGRFLVTSPALLLALWLLREAPWRGGRREPLVGALVVAGLLVPLVAPSLGGKEWGPRYMLAFVPTALLLLAWVVGSRPTLRRAWVALVVAGLAWNLGVGLPYVVRDDATRIRPLVETLADEAPDLVVLTHADLGPELLGVAAAIPMVRISDPGHWALIADAARSAGVERVLMLVADYADRPPEPRFVRDTRAGPLVGTRRPDKLGAFYWVFDVTLP